MLERQLMQMSLNDFVRGRSHAGYQAIGSDDSEFDSDFLSSFSRHLSRFRKRAQHRDERLQPEQSHPSPIFKLPPELFAEIFRALRDDVSCDYAKYTPERCLSWLVVTAVCFSWRAVALSDPSLWSTVPLDGSKFWVNRCIRRSRECPLRILFSPCTLAVHRDIVRSNAWRIEAFVQVGTQLPSSWHDQNCMPGRDPGLMMPMLKEIRVYNDSPYRVLGSAFIQAHAPQIRHLSVVGCLMLRKFASCTQLHTLDVQRTSADFPDSMTPDERRSRIDMIPKFVAMNPLLEVLIIHKYWEDHPQDTVVEMPHLRRLFISGETESMCRLWWRLRFPLDATTQLCFIDSTSWFRLADVAKRDDPHDLRRRMTQGFPPFKGGHPPFEWLRIHGTKALECGTGFSHPLRHPEMYITPPHVTLALEPRTTYRKPDPNRPVAEQGREAKRVKIIMKLCRAIGVRDLRSLTVELPGNDRLTVNDWHEYFDPCVQLRTVKVTHKDLPNLCEALVTLPSLLPSLRMLAVWDPENEFFADKDNMQWPLKWLKARALAKPFTLEFQWKDSEALSFARTRSLWYLRRLSAIEGLQVRHEIRTRPE